MQHYKHLLQMGASSRWASLLLYLSCSPFSFALSSIGGVPLAAVPFKGVLPVGAVQ